MTRTHQIRFMDNNFLRGSRITSSTAMSGYPFSNALNPIRSKVWKPAGNFTVTSSNNLIYINDGANKTATLTAGAYTYATLAAHVQTQLNAVSSSWTCAYDLSGGTFRFTIARSSGAAVLRLSQTTTAAWDLLGYTLTSDQTASPFVAQEQRNHSYEWFKVDLVQPMEIGFVGMIGAISEKLSLTRNAQVRIMANNIDLWDSPPLSVTAAVSDKAALAFLDSVEDRLYRWVYVTITDRLNPLGPEGLSFGCIYAGDYRTPSANIGWGFAKQTTDRSILQSSDDGTIYAQKRPQHREFSSMTIDNLTAADRLSLEQLYADLGLDSQFFVSLDPTLLVSSSLDDMTFYGRFASDPQLTHIIRDRYAISLALRESV